MEAQGEQRRGAAEEEGERERERSDGRQAGTDCAFVQTSEAIPPHNSVISADDRPGANRHSHRILRCPNPAPAPTTKNERQRAALGTNRNRKLTLDGLHGVLHLEKAALGGPHRHVRVVLVAEHGWLRLIIRSYGVAAGPKNLQ